MASSITPIVHSRYQHQGWLPILLGAAFVAIALLSTVSYSAHLLSLFCFYLLLAESLDVALGQAGLMVFCQAALCGCGAYAFSLARVLPVDAAADMPDLIWCGGWSYLPALVASIFAGAASGALVGWLCRRVRGDSLVFVTLAFQMVFHELLYNTNAIGNGVTGIHGIRRPVLGNFAVNSTEGFALIAVLLTVAAMILIRRLRDSGFGLALACMRDDESAVRALGLDSSRITVSVLAVAGAISGLAGALFAGYMRFIDPGSFSLDFSIAVLSTLLLSGFGFQHSSIFCASILVGLPEILRLIGLPSAQAANLRGIFYGAVLMLFVFRRKAACGRYPRVDT